MKEKQKGGVVKDCFVIAVARRKKSNHSAGKKVKSNYATQTIIVLAILVISAYIGYTYRDFLLYKPGGGTLATVDGRTILEEEFSVAFRQISKIQNVTKEEVLDQIITAEALLSEAMREGIEAAEQEVNLTMQIYIQRAGSAEELEESLSEEGMSIEMLEEQIRENIIIQKLIDAKVGGEIPVSESEISRFYNMNNEIFFAGAGQIRASHILLSSEEEANSVLQMIRQGDDFSELAIEYSNDPATAPLGGSLGIISMDMVIEEFAEAAFALKAGEVSGVIKTPFGYHIIKRADRDMLSIDEARDTIIAIVENQKRERIIDTYIDTIVKNADITVHNGAESRFLDAGHEGGVKGEAAEGPERNKLPDDGQTPDNEMSRHNETCINKEGQVIARLFVTSDCMACDTAISAFTRAVMEYGDDLNARIIELDTGDNLITEQSEETVSKSDLALFGKYSPEYGVPAVVIGCRYSRVGNAYQKTDVFGEEKIIKMALEELRG